MIWKSGTRIGTERKRSFDIFSGSSVGPMYPGHCHSQIQEQPSAAGPPLSVRKKEKVGKNRPNMAPVQGVEPHTTKLAWGGLADATNTDTYC